MKMKIMYLHGKSTLYESYINNNRDNNREHK